MPDISSLLSSLLGTSAAPPPSIEGMYGPRAIGLSLLKQKMGGDISGVPTRDPTAARVDQDLDMHRAQSISDAVPRSYPQTLSMDNFLDILGTAQDEGQQKPLEQQQLGATTLWQRPYRYENYKKP